MPNSFCAVRRLAWACAPHSRKALGEGSRATSAIISASVTVSQPRLACEAGWPSLHGQRRVQQQHALVGPGAQCCRRHGVPGNSWAISLKMLRRLGGRLQSSGTENASPCACPGHGTDPGPGSPPARPTAPAHAARGTAWPDRPPRRRPGVALYERSRRPARQPRRAPRKRLATRRKFGGLGGQGGGEQAVVHGHGRDCGTGSWTVPERGAASVYP